MDKELRAYFLRVLYSLIVTVVWMVVNVWGGIYLGWLFFGESIKTGNIIFYSFMVLSLAGLILYFVRLWKGKMDPDPEHGRNINS